jgi:uncharacterized protein YigE (DUF2233 family)
MLNSASRFRVLFAVCYSALVASLGGILISQRLQPVPVEAASASKKSRHVAKRKISKVRPKRRAHATPAIAFRSVTVAGVPMKVVQVDPRRRGVRIAVATARNGVGYRDSWSRMIDRTGPAAAVTGTYFDTHTALPIGLIRVAGRTVYRGGIGTAFAVRNGKGARITTCKPGIGYKFAGYDTVLRAGPRLLTRGKRTLYPKSEGFRDPAVFARKARTAVGIRKDGKVLLVAVSKPVLLRTLAGALRGLGAVDAMCLDGGGSTGLYYRGKSHVQPGRPLTNLLVVYDSSQRYRSMARRLNPSGPRLARAN